MENVAPLWLAAGWTVVVVGGATTTAELRRLCERAGSLLCGRGVVVACDLTLVEAPDLGAVDALARLALLASRGDACLRLRPLSRQLGGLLCMTGLQGVLQGKASVPQGLGTFSVVEMFLPRRLLTNSIQSPWVRIGQTDPS